MADKTGFYIRIQRAGRWQPVDIATLTKQEFDAWAKTLRETEMLEKWLWALIKWIKENVQNG